MSAVRQLDSDSERLIMAADYPDLSSLELFDHFTTPDLLAQWWAPQAEIEPRVGGAYHLSWEAMNWHLRGVYREFARGERLVFTWHWDHEPEKPARTVEIDFAPEGARSTLTLTHGVYAAEDAEERKEHLEGWLYFLERIGKPENK